MIAFSSVYQLTKLTKEWYIIHNASLPDLGLFSFSIQTFYGMLPLTDLGYRCIKQDFFEYKEYVINFSSMNIGMFHG